MIGKFPKPVSPIIFSLFMLLAACADPPNYAPVKTVNQALEPNNGYYLRKRSPVSPKNKTDKIQQPAAIPTKGQHPVNSGALNSKPYQDKTSRTRLSSQAAKRDTESPKKNKSFVAAIDKNEPSKNLKVATLSQQPLDDKINKSIISNTNINPQQKNQLSPPKPPDSSQALDKNKKSIISIDNKKVLKLNFQWPLQGRISRNFSQTDNKGILIKGKTGQAVRAAEAGKAVYCGQGLAGFGNLAIIKHNETYLSAYANNSKLFIKEGEQVEKGQTIGQVGSTGLRSSSLHFEIRKNGKPINPLILLPKH